MKTKIPVMPFQWTNGGDEVLILRYVTRDGKAYGGFQHPMTVGETVTALDWDVKTECGGGIHGWPWGLSIGEGKEADWSALWQVYGADPKDIIDLSGKCKFRTGTLRFVGDWHAAMLYVLAGQMAWVHETASGAASATGESGAASATGWSGAASATGESGAASATGWSGAASATGGRGAASATGWSGAASATGWSGAASATGESGAASATGWSGAASATGESGAASATGWRGAASATGWKGAASATGGSGAASATGGRGAAICTGEEGTAESLHNGTLAGVTGLGGKARAAEFGCIALAWNNKKSERVEMRCALVGKKRGELKPNVWYTLNEKGQFKQVKP